MANKLTRTAVRLMLFVLFASAAFAAERQILSGHVPDAVAAFHLQPLGRLPATNHLHIAINLPLRNIDKLNQLIQA